MPSTKKTLHFLSSALVTSIAVAVIGFSMATDWTKMSIQCASIGSGNFNGSVAITLKPFTGNATREFCPAFGGSEKFSVFLKLKATGTTPLALHSLVVCLLVLCLVFSAGSILIALYNSVSNPYETYMGPVGVYVCSSLSACLSVLALIIFVLNVNVTNMTEKLAENFALAEVDLRDKSSSMQLGFYLVIPYSVLSLVSIALIFMYDHAAYKHRREQQRPTEDAPKEIMMY